MKILSCLSASMLALSMAASASGQIVGGMMTVTGAEMHWWAGVAREATARLYDVDLDSVTFKRLDKSEKYDQAEITFEARPGKLIDLDKLHESIWATRLSGGTRSGLVSLEVTALGKLRAAGDEILLHIEEADADFVLRPHPDKPHAPVLGQLKQAADGTGQLVRVTGVIDNYRGYWPDVLQQKPTKPRHILVTRFELME